MERLTPLPWQQDAWAELAARRERMPHALLLHGSRGIGKRHLMQAFAQLLLCESPRGETACGQCPGCDLLAADNHPDLRWLTPAAQMPERDGAAATDDGEPDEPARGAGTGKAPSREIVIDQVRRTGEFLSVSSHRGGRQVVMLIPAEALNATAANALLKVLEEPPAGAVFLAVTDELDAVLPTIRSRCVLMRAAAPSRAQALQWLESRGVSDAAAKLSEAGGAPVGLEDDTVTVDRHSLDPAVRDALLKMLARGATLTAAEVAGAVPKDITVGPAIRLLQRWGWDLLGERLAGRIRYYPQHKRRYAVLAGSIDASCVVEWTAALAQMQAASGHPLNARLVIESALLSYISAMRGLVGRPIHRPIRPQDGAR